MKRITQFFQHGAMALALTLAITACDSSTSALQDETSSDAAQFSMMLAGELGMSDAQYAAVEQTAAQHGGDDVRDPAYLWYLAAQLAEDLSDEQKAALIERSRTMGLRLGQGPLDGPFGRPGEGGGPLPGLGHGGPNGLERAGAGPHDGIGSLLTDAQKEALHALREAYREQVKAAVQAVRNAAAGAERDEQVAALRALNEEIRAAVDAWLEENLTAEQKAQIEANREERENAREAAREAVRTAIDDIFGGDRAAALEAIHDAFVEDVEAARGSGGSAESARAVIEEAAADRDAAIEALLGDQYEIYLIHRALAMRAQHHRGGGGPAGAGHSLRPGGSMGPGGPMGGTASGNNRRRGPGAPGQGNRR